MNHKMFCFQCEQTAGCAGCTGKAGVCGKTADVAKLQDELTGALIGLAFGAVMALKKKGHKEVIKIPGCELWLRIINMTYQQGKSYYLVGGKQEVIERTVKKLKEDYPGIRIANFRNGYIKTEEERKNLLEDIVTKRPDVVFVAMGSPKQELLMEEMAERHKAVYQGLGGSFDVYTGNVKRAPQWWVRHNLEWAYRLVKEPVRIKRQIHLVRFLLRVKLGLI